LKDAVESSERVVVLEREEQMREENNEEGENHSVQDELSRIRVGE